MIWNNAPKFIPVDQQQAKKVTPEQLAKSGSEDGHQMAVFAWAADNVDKYPQLEYLFAIPNGGQRHIAEATKFVATGLRKGVPDIFLPFGINNAHGLFIEMKIEKKRNTKDGGLSKEQLDWIPALKQAGYAVAVCYSWIEARDCIINYLEGKL